MALMRVRYTGLSDERSMSKSELASVGVGVSGQMKWDRGNRWSVFVSDPSDDLLEVLKNEGTFKVEEVDEETGSRVKQSSIITPTRMDDTGNTVVDGSTGQVSQKPGT